MLLTEHPARGYSPTPREAPTIQDYVRFPAGCRSFGSGSHAIQNRFIEFMRRQWGLRAEDVPRWKLQWSVRGRYAWRIVIPVIMHGQPVGFQARTILDNVEPKYLTSRHGPLSDPDAECGRPSSEWLFNYDALAPESECLLVEGPGDVMAWHSRHSFPVAVGLLGLNLTPAKVEALVRKTPERIIVATDVGAESRALDIMRDLEFRGLAVALGQWHGGKDAGAGATLRIIDPDPSPLYRIRARLQTR